MKLTIARKWLDITHIFSGFLTKSLLRQLLLNKEIKNSVLCNKGIFLKYLIICIFYIKLNNNKVVTFFVIFVLRFCFKNKL